MVSGSGPKSGQLWNTLMNNAAGIPWNCGTIAGTGIPVYTFKKPSIGGDSFILVTNESTRTTTSASSGTSSVQDLLYVTSSGATTISDYFISINQSVPDYIPITVTSSNTGVLSNPVNGVASGIIAGSATLTASGNNEFSARMVTVSSVIGTTNSVLSGYVSSSVSYAASSGIDSRISGKSASTAKSIFTTQNHGSSIYVRNSGCWAYDLDLTSISPWNSTGANTRAGTLISPRHIIFAAHYQINNGSIIRFVTTDNTVVERTMINKVSLSQTLYPDITIGVLDSDVPNTIGYVKVLPSNWSSYLPNVGAIYRIPALALDYEEKALVTELGVVNGGTLIFYTPINAQRLSFFETIIVGDSGNPVFLIINGQLVLLTVWTWGGSGGGTFVTYFKNDINSAMSSLGGGYTLTEVDLSGFTSY